MTAEAAPQRITTIWAASLALKLWVSTFSATMGAIAATAVNTMPQMVLLTKMLLDAGCPVGEVGCSAEGCGGVWSARVMALFSELNKVKCMLSQNCKLCPYTYARCDVKTYTRMISITMWWRGFGVRDGLAEGRSPNCAFAKA
jgi:hypothetical protein